MSNLPRQVSVRLDPDLAAKVARAAELERRTVSNLVRKLILDWDAARAAGGDQRHAA
jgi:predicted transcriptional regulator